MSKLNDEILGHGDESDGIEEYDNPLPDWWVGLFLITILWGGWYLLDWHVLSPKSQESLYLAEMEEARTQWPDLDKGAAFDDSPAVLAQGGELFAANCASCHGVDLRGGIGANLVDTEWIHGGTFDDVVATITAGVAAKGMPGWGPILGPKKIAATASFILSKQTGEAPAAKPDGAADAGGSAEAPVAADAEGAAEVNGELVFATNCVVCHKADMTGGIGPNLVDDEWIHGGELAQIQTTVEKGVPAKGMISWKGTLSDAEIAAVSQYVYDKSR